MRRICQKKRSVPIGTLQHCEFMLQKTAAEGGRKTPSLAPRYQNIDGWCEPRNISGRGWPGFSLPHRPAR